MQSDLLTPLDRVEQIRQWRKAAEAAHVAECVVMLTHIRRAPYGGCVDPELQRKAKRLRAAAEQLRQQVLL